MHKNTATFNPPASKLSRSQVEETLGENASRFTAKGIDFWRFRTSPRGSDPIHCSAVMELYLQGKLNNVAATFRKELADVTGSGYTTLSPEALAILLMGRMPKQRGGKWEEHSKRLTDAQFTAAQKLANKLKSLEGVYINKAPRSKPAEPEAPATADTSQQDAS